MASRVLLYSDDRFLAHDNGPGHPERPDRLRAILARLRDGPVDGVAWRQPRAATRDELCRVHRPSYVDDLLLLRGRTCDLGDETAVAPGSIDAAEHAAGAVLDAVETVLSGDVRRAFALIRPPGHHAEADRAMGFCLFGNVAIAAAHAVAALGCRRVLVIDWDYHHGNGTQHMLESRRDVLVINAHAGYDYPGTGRLDEIGRGDGLGYTVNCPLPRGCDDALYVHLFETLVAPIADAYEPDLVLVSAGFDSHRDDPLGTMNMTADGFAALTAITQAVAERHAGGRLVLALEGGYDLDGLAASVHACVRTLAGAAPPAIDPPGEATRQLVDHLRHHHAARWPTLVE